MLLRTRKPLILHHYAVNRDQNKFKRYVKTSNPQKVKKNESIKNVGMLVALEG